MKKFTLLELVVIIAIIGILMTLLLPSLQNSKDAAATAVCLSNEKQVYATAQVYAANNGSKLPALNGNDNNGNKTENPSGGSAIDQIMLFAAGYSKYADANGEVYKMDAFLCPVDRKPEHTKEGNNVSSYKPNHYPWQSGGEAAGTHQSSSWQETQQAKIRPKNDQWGPAEMIMFSEGDHWRVRNYKAEIHNDNDESEWFQVYWHYRLDHRNLKNSYTLNNVYFDGHAKKLSHWLSTSEMISTQWGEYVYDYVPNDP